ncbi:MAG: helix-turn-helix domain-containing protein [Acetatifactor sp.]|nr:helix-turn-helix domain-containing protein [Acetatifactor sp.]
MVVQENNMDKDNVQIANKYDGKILKQTDLYEIFPFEKTKIQQLIKSGELPIVKVGKDYITTFKLIEEWIEKHVGEEIFY